MFFLIIDSHYHYVLQVVFDRRFEKDNGSICKISVDGTDFKINEPSPFSGMWYSHKYDHAAVRYEIGLCIQKGYIVSTHGPFPAGLMPDVSIFCNKLKYELAHKERVECDRGYRGEFSKIDLPDECCGYGTHQYKLKQIVRARHETVNRRLKQFGCLKQQFRHPIHKYSSVFCAVVAIVQISLENGHPLFDLAHEYKTIDDKFL